jgi:hypothetical protein
MILGFVAGPVRRPMVEALVSFPSLPGELLAVRFLIDTGAQRSLLAPLQALRLEQLGVSFFALARDVGVVAVGGAVETRTISAEIHLAHRTFTLPGLAVMAPPPPANFMPSLLGRDILRAFTLVINDQENVVWLLE